MFCSSYIFKPSFYIPILFTYNIQTTRCFKCSSEYFVHCENLKRMESDVFFLQVGLALSYAAPIVSLLGSFLTSFTETEKEMVSVERTLQVLQYTSFHRYFPSDDIL